MLNLLISPIHQVTFTGNINSFSDFPFFQLITKYFHLYPSFYTPVAVVVEGSVMR